MAASNSRNPEFAARRRLLFLGICFLFWIAAIGARLFWLQIICYGEFTERADRQQRRTIEVSPKRGVIYDRNGHELAMSVMVDSIFAVPSELSDPALTATLLAKVVHTDADELLARFRAARSFAWVARKVDDDTSRRVRDLNLRGIYFQKEAKRFYPKRELAAQALGYVGLDGEGLAGLERVYDEPLRGKPGRMLITMDARRRWFGRVEREPDAGQSLVLTIDEKIQYIAERELALAMQQTGAMAGTVIVERPHSGEILALANQPTFNPNDFQKFPQQALNDRAISDIYEPGSTFKIVTLTAALNENVARPDDLVDCQHGAIYLAGVRIRDHASYGDLTVAQILQHSSDVGAIKIGLRLGEQRFDHYIRAFGFGAQTGIELPGETRGIARPVSRWSKVSIGAISMGQEIGVSPVQLAAMVSTIANDGTWVAPRIVAGEVEPRAGFQTVVFHPAAERRVVSALTAVEMKRMMEGVVLGGTGRRAILDGYSVAGKTGTAQKADPATGAYSRSDYVASFAGFAPVNSPAITVVVILDSPRGQHEGGEVAAPVFARIAQQVLEYLNVPHDIPLEDARQLQMQAAANPQDLIEGATDRVSDGTPVEDSASATAPVIPLETGQTPSLPLKPIGLTSAALVRPPAAAEPTPPAHGTVVLDLGDGLLVPSFLGKPLREAVVTAEQSGLEINVIGSGVAREQSPAPGSHISPGTRVTVVFAQ